MKSISSLLFCVLAILLWNCDKNETNDINPAVENYIELLKSNQYESGDLPEFTSNDIPALLGYINDNSVVNIFPQNHISSYAPPDPEYRLGVLVLWTIESIRVVSGGEPHVRRFPSQNPFVETKSEPIEWITNHNNVIYDSVRQAYSGWWAKNKNKKFSSFCNIDPLENTDYRWH